MAIKRDKYDAIFSDCIREAAHWTCERCGLVDDDGVNYGKSRATHCSHIYGRYNKSTRWHPDNALCLCNACHKEVTSSPLEHSRVAHKLLGEVRYDALMVLAKSVKKWTKAEKLEMYEHYKSELEQLKSGKKDQLVSYQ